MIRGVSVTLLQLSRSGAAPSWTPVTVENVLIAPLLEVDSTAGAQETAHRAIYHLAVPKDDTHRWEGQLVQFWGQTWAVIGIPTEGIDDLIPGPWNKKVTVELYRTAAPDVDSLWRDRVTLFSPVRNRDASGFDGPGISTPREVNAILPHGVSLAVTEDGQRFGLRHTLNAEIWEADYQGDLMLGYDTITYDVKKISQTGRGTVLLQCEEAWR